ncbi:MAG: ATP-binding protein [Chloroflexota bacterium]|nr:MAG: transcriptional regulator [Chloroflexota bacterium]
MSETADDLWQAIKGGRNARTDWMSESTSVEALATTMVAMANSQGGVIVLGVVGPTATVIGVRDPESAVDRVLQAALAIEPPLIIPMPKVRHLKTRPVVVAYVPRGMPHVYSLDGRYLYREGVNNTALKPRDIRRLMMERGETSFETDIVRGASTEDIDWDKAKAYVDTLGALGDSSVEEVLIKRGCLATQDGLVRPTNAGILLFGKEPQRHVRGADITAARFAGETMSDIFTRQDIRGSLPDQIRRAETFLRDNLRKDFRLGDSMTREERYEYPMEAARELVVNAVAHRDYSIQGDGIRLFLFSDRMEVTSPGGLPGPVTLSNIREERFSRNPVIVQVLSDMGFIERLGYGVDRVIDLMAQQNLRAPEFVETAGGFRVTLYSQPQSAGAGADGNVAASDKPFVFDGQYRGVPINIRQEAALTYLLSGNSRITNSDLQALCPDVHPETIRRDLADLVTKNILRKLGQKRGSYYVLKRD